MDLTPAQLAAAVAVHEASHAALALMAGRKNARLRELIVRDDSSGLCRVLWRQQSPHSIIAGYVGELRALEGKDWRPTPQMFNDAMHLDDIADAAAIVGVERLPALWLETVPMVDRAWHRIQAMAAALQRSGRLSGAEAEAIWLSSTQATEEPQS